MTRRPCGSVTVRAVPLTCALLAAGGCEKHDPPSASAEDDEPPGAAWRAAGKAAYLPFVTAAVEKLLERQTARLGGWADGPPCVTVTMPPARTWTSVGIWLGDRYELLHVPARAVQMQPTAMDFGAWPLLDDLSAATGDPRYRRLVDAMTAAFVAHGFHPTSGLLLEGAMFRFDVVAMGPAATSIWEEPSFKPAGDLPWERLWEAAPDKMARFSRATYYGLITRPETMDFNRYCTYEFDDSRREHVTRFSPRHRGFIYTAAMLVKYWAMLHARTGDGEALRWVRAMTDKWAALQNPDTGLLPHFVGAIEANDPDQPPTPYANTTDSRTAVLFMEAADLLAQRREARPPADALRRMGLRFLQGLARNGYDEQGGIFPEWIRLEGGQYTENTFYMFRTEADRQAAIILTRVASAVKRRQLANPPPPTRPIVEEVDVFAGPGFFTQAPMSITAGVGLPADVARGAAMTGDEELLAAARRFAELVLAEARGLKGPRNAEGQWTYPALAAYARMMLDLREATGEQAYLESACELADIALRQLAEPAEAGEVEWWRLPPRCGLLETLLSLERALAGA